jgi:hypothetical protein
MSLIIPANSLAGGGYEVDNSLRFNNGSSDYLSRTPGSAGNTKKFTISFWVKRSVLGTEQDIIHAYPGSGSRSQVIFNSANQLALDLENNTNNLITTRLFRDISAWYHIVIVYDSDNGTTGNRVILYINGVRETSFGTEQYPSSGSTSQINTTTQHEISSYDGVGQYLDCYLSEFVFLDGTAAAVTDFGEFDEDSGIWKPIDVSGLTFGTNGFYLDFKDSAALGDDVSGNGNDFTVNNLTSIDQTTDTPTNNFCTMNALLTGSNITLKEGNTFTAANTAATGNSGSTFQIPETGKWYFEVKLTMSTGDTYPNCGIKYDSTTSQGSMNGGAWNPDVYVYGNYPAVKVYVTGGTNVTSGSAYATDDIARFAIDQDNGAIYVSQNETWWNSGNPESGASKTGAVRTFTAGDYPNMTCCTFEYNDSITKWNFGNPAYTITTGNADANGYGNFEYAVPAGYLSLCTSNLSEVNS